MGSTQFLMRLRNLGLQLDVAHDETWVMALARKHSPSAYDAAYPKTALRRGNSLATLDRSLANTARSEAVSLIH